MLKTHTHYVLQTEYIYFPYHMTVNNLITYTKFSLGSDIMRNFCYKKLISNLFPMFENIKIIIKNVLNCQQRHAEITCSLYMHDMRNAESKKLKVDS